MFNRRGTLHVEHAPHGGSGRPTEELDVRNSSNRLRSGITFTRLNLLDDGRMAFMKSMDVIFCCNVLIYFDVLSKRRVIQHFYNNLLPQGYLFLGHSESLFGITDDFRLVHLPSTTAYVKSQHRRAVSR